MFLICQFWFDLDPVEVQAQVYLQFGSNVNPYLFLILEYCEMTFLDLERLSHTLGECSPGFCIKFCLFE